MLGKFGRKIDVIDKRDFIIPRVFHLGIGAPLPSSCDVFKGLDLPIYDQGDIGSCTANAGVLYRRFLAQKFSQYSTKDEDLSRLFLYYMERSLPWNNDISKDSGAAIRDICITLNKTGVCLESDDPYITTDFAKSPDIQAIMDSNHYKVGAYHRVTNTDGIKSCLASGYAVLLGFTVYSSFDNIGSDGIMPMPSGNESIDGGHAVVIRGYDNSLGKFYIQNSWGKSWGEDGCFWMPYEFLNSDMSQCDMWMCHLGVPWR